MMQAIVRVKRRLERGQSLSAYLLIAALAFFGARFVLGVSGLVAYRYAGFLIAPHDSHDSWEVMFDALDYLADHRDGGIYGAVAFVRHEKFQYPLTALIFVHPLYALGGRPYIALNALNSLFCWATGFASAATAFVLYGRLDAKVSLREKALSAAVVFVLAVLINPVIYGNALGQIQIVIDALFAMAVLLWLLDRKLMAGVLIGLASLIHPQLLFFMPWSLVRRQWAFSLGWAVTAGAGALLAVRLYGFENNLDYLGLAQFLSRRGEAYYANQSVNGLLNRLIFNGVADHFDPHLYPNYNVYVYLGTLATSALLALSAILWRRSGPGSGSALDFCCAGLAFTMASPIVWEHHYGVIPSLFVVAVFCSALCEAPARQRYLLGLLVCYLGVAVDPGLARAALGTPFSLLASYMFFAALATLAIGYRLRSLRADRALVPTASRKGILRPVESPTHFL